MKEETRFVVELKKMTDLPILRARNVFIPDKLRDRGEIRTNTFANACDPLLCKVTVSSSMTPDFEKTGDGYILYLNGGSKVDDGEFVQRQLCCADELDKVYEAFCKLLREVGATVVEKYIESEIVEEKTAEPKRIIPRLSKTEFLKELNRIGQ